MLKGYTKIELTNVHTGEKEVVEKHNIITNFLNDYITFSMLFTAQYTIRKELCPLYKLAMGGIQLFKEQVPENANSYLMNYETPEALTGCATNTTFSTTDVKVGSKNVTESSKIEGGYKYVWDFATSQANGDISAVGLCASNATISSGTAVALFHRLGVVEKVYKNSIEKEINRRMVDYDFDNHIFTTIEPDNTTTSTTANVIVKKIRLNLKKIGLYEGETTSNFLRTSLEIIEEKKVELSEALNTKGIWKYGYDGYYYYIDLNGNTSKIARMSMTTLKMDLVYGVKTFSTTCKTTDVLVNHSYCSVANGFLYIRIADKKLQKINLENITDITNIDLNFSMMYHIKTDGKRLFTTGRIIYPNDTYEIYNKYLQNNAVYSKITFDDLESEAGSISNNDNYGVAIIKDGKYVVAAEPNYANARLYFGIMANQLCTINNLEETVTKTPDKTMKITYTITEVEDE